jgi:hypothetical protein
VGLGTEILFMAMLGLLVLGLKQLHTLLGHGKRPAAASRLNSWRNSTLRIGLKRLIVRMITKT